MTFEWYEIRLAWLNKYRETGELDAAAVCLRCGCRVEDTDIHDAWHEGMDERE